MLDYDTGFSRLAVGPVPTVFSGGIPPDAFELLDTQRYWSTHLDGFGRPKSGLSFIESPGGNYSTFSLASITERTLSFDLYPQGDVARNIQLMNQHMPFGRLLRFYVDTVDHRACYIDGVVEELPDDVEAGKLRVSDVVVRCPYPWFTGLLRHKIPLTAASTTLHNDGDIPTGFCLYVTEPGTVSRFAVSDENGNRFELSGAVSFGEMDENYPAFRSVDGKHDTYGLRADGSWMKLFGSMISGSTLFQLNPGETVLTVSEDLIGRCMVVYQESYSYAVM